MTSYPSLPALWADLIDALSGRSSDLIDPPVMTADWPDISAPGWISAGVVGSDLNVTVIGPSGLLDLLCPLPSDDAATLRNILADEDFRRTLVYSWTTEQNLHAPIPTTVIRDTLFAAAFGSQSRFTWDELTSLDFHPDFDVTLGLTLTSFVFPPLPGWHPSTSYPPLSYFDGVLDLAFDICAVLAVRAADGVSFTPVTPADTDLQEPLATLLQFPAGAAIGVPGPDILALNNLADALSRGRGINGSVQTHRSRDLLTVSSGFVTLSRPTGTSDDMMHRVATAVRCWLGGSLALPTTGKKALVALNRGILLKGR